MLKCLEHFHPNQIQLKVNTCLKHVKSAIFVLVKHLNFKLWRCEHVSKSDQAQSSAALIPVSAASCNEKPIFSNPLTITHKIYFVINKEINLISCVAWFCVKSTPTLNQLKRANFSKFSRRLRISWVMTPYSLANGCQYFGGKYWLH